MNAEADFFATLPKVAVMVQLLRDALDPIEDIASDARDPHAAARAGSLMREIREALLAYDRAHYRMRHWSSPQSAELVHRLTAVGLAHRGTDLGGLLQWAVLHLQRHDATLRGSALAVAAGA